MGLDVIGTVAERRSERPVTIGGRAHRRYLDYVRSFVPGDYRPDLHPDLRVKRYFRAQGMRVAATNVYIALAATFLFWPLIPVIQPFNLYRYVRSRASRARERGDPQW